ncbi:MAG: hypothetical protein ACREIS_08190 [Nitrospiraceae bacterium]
MTTTATMTESEKAQARAIAEWHRANAPRPTSYGRHIQAATVCPDEWVGAIESLMRDEVAENDGLHGLNHLTAQEIGNRAKEIWAFIRAAQS